MALVRLNKDSVNYEFDPTNPANHLGTGGMGVVFKGRRIDTERGHADFVAIKVLFKDLPAESVDRARREASIQVEHENVIRMYGCIDVVDAEQRVTCHVISEYLDGDTLDKRSDNGEVFAEAEAIKIVKCILSGLYMIHGKGYIHRDIDPSNVMMCRDGKIKLIDFGIVKNIAAKSDVDEGMETIKKGTQVGKFIGKVFYASPEQAQGLHSETDYRSDVYSVGILLYQLLTGKVPFVGNTLYDIVKQHIESPIVFSTSINVNLQHIIGRATAKKKEDRYQSVSEFIVDLEKYEKGISIPAPNLSGDKSQTKRSNHSWVYVVAAIFSLLILGGMSYVYFSMSSAIQVAQESAKYGQYDKAIKQYEDATKIYASSSTKVEIDLLRDANQVIARYNNTPYQDSQFMSDLIAIGDRGFSDGYYYYAEQSLDGALSTQELSFIANNLIKGMQDGNILSTYRLGEMYIKGEQFKPNEAKAQECFNIVSNAINKCDIDELSTELKYVYGKMCRYGYSVTQDDAKAQELFETVAKTNHPGAIYELYLLKSKNKESDAMDYLDRAVELGYTKAEYDLAMLKIAEKDYKGVKALLQVAHDKKYAPATEQLALIYYYKAQSYKRINRSEYTKYMKLAIETKGGDAAWSGELSAYLKPKYIPKPVKVAPVVAPPVEKKPEEKPKPKANIGVSWN